MLSIDKYEALKQYFGHSEFRFGQEDLVDALLAGRDVLGVMPTGAGKSVCYQLPALLLPGITLVLSPLISLMKDQVASLTQAGIPAAFINSTLSPEQYREVFRRARRGAYKLIYAAPERLETPDFLRFAQEVEISLLAVDEAHCVSQWGQDFRPSYLKIADFLQQLPYRPPVGAFTATATRQVKEDIQQLLLLRDPLCLTTGFDRPNLFFEVVRTRDKEGWLEHFLDSRPGQSGIVYCATRKAVEAVCAALTACGVPAARYHAGLPEEERRRSQEDFEFDRVRVMVATNAFGMGIDKSNVSFVVHYNMPKDVESYYQEAGRAGRDGSPAHCALLFSAQDVRTARFLIDHTADNEELPEEEREQLRLRDLNRLDRMTSYCKTTGCLRAFLLRYFGQEAPESCGACGNCSGVLEDGHHGGGPENSLRRDPGGTAVPLWPGDRRHGPAAPGEPGPAGAPVGPGQAAHLRRDERDRPRPDSGLHRLSGGAGLPASGRRGIPGAAHHPTGETGAVPGGAGLLYLPQAGPAAAPSPAQRSCQPRSRPAGGSEPL